MIKTLIYAYLIGGLTFLPLTFIGIAIIIFLGSPKVERDEVRKAKDESDVKQEVDPASIHEAYKVGWLTIRTKYTVENTDGTYVGMVMQSYRQFMDNRKGVERRPRDVFFAVLRHDTLLLYENEDQIGCKHIIKISLHDVTIYPEGIPEGELFLKRNAIRLQKKLEFAIGNENGVVSEFFIFHSSPSEKEDWYFALIHAQNLTIKQMVARPVLDADALRHLKSTLKSNDLQKELAWFNGLFGRIFLGIHRRTFLRDYFVDKFMKKITRARKPSFLGEVKVRSVNVGDTIPYVTKPKLLDIHDDGRLEAECHLSYAGNFRIEIETVATINLSNHLKPMNVPLVLAVVLKQWHGKMKIVIKPPPSNRIWYCFHQMPKVDIAVEPIISTRQIKYPIILKAIEAKIHELIIDSIVLPNMDDIPFAVTLGEDRRGGLWSGNDVLRGDSSSKTGENVATNSTDGETTEENLQNGNENSGLSQDLESEFLFDHDTAESQKTSPRSSRSWLGKRPLLFQSSIANSTSIPEASVEDMDVPEKEIKKSSAMDVGGLAVSGALKDSKVNKDSILVVPAPKVADTYDDEVFAESLLPSINLEEGKDVENPRQTRSAILAQSMSTATSTVKKWGMEFYQRRRSRVLDVRGEKVDSRTSSDETDHIKSGSLKASYSKVSASEPCTEGVEKAIKDLIPPTITQPKPTTDELDIQALCSNRGAISSVPKVLDGDSVEPIEKGPTVMPETTSLDSVRPVISAPTFRINDVFESQISENEDHQYSQTMDLLGHDDMIGTSLL